MNVISAVPFGSEILMADIVPECLEELKMDKKTTWEVSIGNLILIMLCKS